MYMATYKQFLTVIISKITFSKDGRIYFTIHYPLSKNFPSLVFKKEDIAKDERLKEIFERLTKYGN